MFKKDTLKDLKAVFLLLVLDILFFFRLLFLDKMFVFRDFYRYFYPYKFYVSECIKKGILPLWNPYNACGMPMLGTLQSQIFYPLSMVHYLLPFNIGLKLFIVIHFFIAGCSMYYLSREFKFERHAAFLSGVIFSLSGYMLSAVDMLTTLCSAAWMPLIVLLFVRAEAAEKIKHCALFSVLCGFVLALQFLAGEPTVLLCTLGILLVFAFYSSKKKSILLGLGFIVVSFLAFSAFQLFPFIEFLLNSNRMNPAVGKTLEWSMHPKYMFNLIFNYIFGDITKIQFGFLDSKQKWLKSLYMGIGPLLLSFLLLFRAGKTAVTWKYRKILLAVFLFSLFFALGGYNPLARYLFESFPGLSLMRYPIKLILPAIFSLSLFAGLGLNAALKPQNKNFYPIIRNVLLFISGILFLLYLVLSLFKNSLLDLYGILLNPSINDLLIMQERCVVVRGDLFFLGVISLVFLGLSHLYIKGKMRIKVLGPAVILIIVLDLFINLFFLNPLVEADFYRSRPESVSVLKKLKKYERIQAASQATRLKGSTYSEAMSNAKEMMFPNTNLFYRIYSANGYDSINVKRYIDFIDFCQEQNNIKYLAFFNAPYVLAMEKIGQQFKKEAEIKDVGVYLNEKTLPRCVFTDKYTVLSDKEGVLIEMRKKEFDPFNTFLVEARTMSPAGMEKESRVKEVSIQKYEENSLSMRVDTDTDGLLVLFDTYFPGCNAYIDGKRTPLLIADYTFRGVKVGKGRHEIDLSMSLSL